jgi:hypothetical protein
MTEKKLTIDEIRERLDPALLRHNSPKFEPKLTFAERCAVLALHMQGASISALAATFGINRRTVKHLISPSSTRYRAVRDQAKAMGDEDFCREYITETIASRFNEAKDSPEVHESMDDYDTVPKADRAGIPSPRASAHAGTNMWTPPGAEYAHRIEIKWLEANTAEDDTGPFEHPAGWYSRDLDGETPDRWDGDPENGSHTSSAKALAYAKRG